MCKTIIIYGSTTGNCESIAGAIEKNLKSKGLQTTLKNVANTSVNELFDYDLILLGSSTWGDGGLQDDFIEFDKSLSSTNLSNKKVAIFGVGNTGWPNFCGSVDTLETSIQTTGAILVGKSLRVDVDLDRNELEEWVEQIIS